MSVLTLVEPDGTTQEQAVSNVMLNVKPVAEVVLTVSFARLEELKHLLLVLLALLHVQVALQQLQLAPHALGYCS